MNLNVENPLEVLANWEVSTLIPDHGLKRTCHRTRIQRKIFQQNEEGKKTLNQVKCIKDKTKELVYRGSQKDGEIIMTIYLV